MPLRFALSALVAAVTVSACFGEASAGTIVLNHTFETGAPQSIYGPGPASTVGSDGVFSTPWSDSYIDGSISTVCALDICASFGKQTRATTDGRAGFTVSPRATGGEVTASLPVSIGLGLPNGPLHAGQPFTVTSTFGVTSPSFRATSPQFSLGIDMTLTANITVDHTECSFTCTRTGPLPLDVNNFRSEVLGLNRGFDNTLRVFGQELVDDLASKSIPLPLREKELQIKDVTRIYTLGRVRLFPFPFIAVEEIGSGADPFSGSDSVEVVRLAADVGNITAYAFALSGIPIPPLNAKVAGSFPFTFGYNALQMDAGISLGMRNTFTLDPEGAIIRLRLDQTGDVYEFRAGESVDITFPEGFDEVTFTPTIELDAPWFRTDIDALISPLIDISAIGVTLFGVPLALIDPPPYHVTDFPLNVVDRSFALGGFEDFTGDPIRLSLNQDAPVPLPPTLVLLALGLLAARGTAARRSCRRSSRRRRAGAA